MIGYCLTTLDEPAMWQLSAIINARLTPRERAFLAVAALWGLDDDEYQRVIAAMEGEG